MSIIHCQLKKKLYLCKKLKKMVLEVKEITENSITSLLVKMRKRKKKSLYAHFGKLKRGIDGLEYQKLVRNEWN